MSEDRKSRKLKTLAGYVVIDAIVLLLLFAAYKGGILGSGLVLFLAIVLLSGTVGNAAWMIFGPRSE